MLSTTAMPFKNDILGVRKSGGQKAVTWTVAGNYLAPGLSQSNHMRLVCGQVAFALSICADRSLKSTRLNNLRPMP